MAASEPMSALGRRPPGGEVVPSGRSVRPKVKGTAGPPRASTATAPAKVYLQGRKGDSDGTANQCTRKKDDSNDTDNYKIDNNDIDNINNASDHHLYCSKGGYILTLNKDFVSYMHLTLKRSSGILKRGERGLRPTSQRARGLGIAPREGSGSCGPSTGQRWHPTPPRVRSASGTHCFHRCRQPSEDEEGGGGGGGYTK